MQIADKRRRVSRLARDSYRGVIRLIGPGKRRQEYEHTSDDHEYRNNLHNAFQELILKANAPTLSKAALMSNKKLR